MPPAPVFTAPVQILPVEAVHLPAHYRFHVQFLPHKLKAVPPQNLLLQYGVGLNLTWPLADADRLDRSGFTKLLFRILIHGHANNLWGQDLTLWANYRQPDGLVHASTKSANSVTLTYPKGPFTLGPYNVLDAISSLGWGHVSPPKGHRIFWAPNPSMPRAWYVGTDNRLLAHGIAPAFDRISFWSSMLMQPIEKTRDLATGAQLASLLGAFAPPRIPAQGTAAQIAAAVGEGTDLNKCMVWSSNRLLLYRVLHPFKFVEYGPGGLQELTLQEWAAAEGASGLWHVRKLPPAALQKTASTVF